MDLIRKLEDLKQKRSLVEITSNKVFRGTIEDITENDVILRLVDRQVLYPIGIGEIKQVIAIVDDQLIQVF